MTDEEYEGIKKTVAEFNNRGGILYSAVLKVIDNLRKENNLLATENKRLNMIIKANLNRIDELKMRIDEMTQRIDELGGDW